jgi:palmitoyl-[glycerolipid] 3-(E)-desaturase
MGIVLRGSRGDAGSGLNRLSMDCAARTAMISFIPAVLCGPVHAQRAAAKPLRICRSSQTCTPVRCKVEAAKRQVVALGRIAPSASPARPRKAPELHVGADSIESTPAENLLVVGFGLLAFLTAAKVATLVAGDWSAAACACAAAVGGYLFADFGTGVYHFLVDNYGNESTPLVGYQIAAFQGHHKSPWTITCRDFANNLFRLTIPTSPQMLALLLLPLPPALVAGLSSALFWIVASQELHKQAHMQRPARYACILQDFGLAVSRKEHGLHHTSPFAGHYCIVSGIFNPLLDGTLFFRRLEAAIYRVRGVEPISWRLSPALKELALSLGGPDESPA